MYSIKFMLTIHITQMPAIIYIYSVDSCKLQPHTVYEVHVDVKALATMAKSKPVLLATYMT